MFYSQQFSKVWKKKFLKNSKTDYAHLTYILTGFLWVHFRKKEAKAGGGSQSTVALDLQAACALDGNAWEKTQRCFLQHAYILL